MSPDKCDCLSRQVVDRLITVGRVYEMIKAIFDYSVFDNLSKHDPFWNGECVDFHHRMDQMRMQLGAIHQDIGKILEVIEDQHEH